MASRLASKVKPFNLRIHFSNQYCYAQVVRVADNHVVAAASTIERGVQESLPGRSRADTVAASRVGEVIAQRAQQAGIAAVHWPRKRGQRYHGRIKALIESLKATGVGLN